ncbi:MAG: hypothetical protein AMS18_08165 [Gemmatimonas sp. SG8_17]|nr:MAG: hypothetical protein AMS18_08165 [Gemmatimonas sp. SG8_17]
MSIVENDIRLMRRMLVLRQVNDDFGLQKIEKHLRNVRKLSFNLRSPESQSTFLNRLQPNERWLAQQFGFVELPDYHDTVFLNSRWANPATLYVRLVEPVSGLQEYGEIMYMPPEIERVWHEIERATHTLYSQLFAPRVHSAIEGGRMEVELPKQVTGKVLRVAIKRYFKYLWHRVRKFFARTMRRMAIWRRDRKRT